MIEELLKQVPVFVIGNDKKNTFECGLNFRWSVTNECWLIGYGGRPRIDKPGVGNGATLQFALKDFIEKQKQFEKSNPTVNLGENSR